MARRYARELRGERVIDKVPHGHWKTTTFIAGLRHDRIVAPAVFDGPMDADCFRAYVKEVLAPCLSPGDIVILDNLSTHKVSGIWEPIASAGASLRYLPPYSPDMNPIERVWSKVKAMLRAAARRSMLELWDTFGELLGSFSPEECANYFKNSGYAPPRLT